MLQGDAALPAPNKSVPTKPRLMASGRLGQRALLGSQPSPKGKNLPSVWMRLPLSVESKSQSTQKMFDDYNDDGSLWVMW